MSCQNAATCTFSKGRHSTASCGIVTDVSARKVILRNEGCSFICLKKNHLAKIKCFECGRRHHVSVCEAKNPALPKNPQAKTNLYLSTRGNILRQTACSEVSSCPSVKTRVILDLGSQRNYITRRLSGALQLQKIRSENLLIKTFGSASEQF